MTNKAEQIAAGLTEAQRARLLEVCRTNGGGVRISCRVDDNGYGIPTNPVFRALWERDLIQGKSGEYETVVHTRLGLAVREILIRESQP